MLFKSSKPGADPTDLKDWRPISLRETDYKILTKLVVSRLNPLLSSSIPPAQHGFVAGRQSSDAGTHLRFLVEQVRASGLEEAALLSLDQEKAYDLVDHDWIVDCYEAFGAPARFLSLLRTLYDGGQLRARFIVNGFLSDGIALQNGLPQGDPLSCASWIVSFQPFLDALIRRKIALMLPSPVSLTRPEILTTLAFADDSLVVVESISTALPALRTLSADWYLATNGRLNTDKTEATAIGARAQEDTMASSLRWTVDEGFVLWAGFPFSPRGDTSVYYSLLLDRLQQRADKAAAGSADVRSRALFANTHLLSRSQHLLSFVTPPPTFLSALSKLLFDFVWNGRYHPVAQSTVFSPTSLGGLGLLNPANFALSHSLRFLARLYGEEESIWRDLAWASLHRACNLPLALPADVRGGLGRFSFQNAWSVFSPSFPLPADECWRSVITAGKLYPPSLDVDRLSPAELVSLPPSLFSSHPLLRRTPTIADLYYRPNPTAARPPGLYSFPANARAAKVSAWEETVKGNPALANLLPPRTPIDQYSLTPIPLPVVLRAPAFTFLDHSPPFSSRDIRQSLNATATPTQPALRLPEI
ncbi:hypothetical protein JCM1841_003199, partial [Sporobolomyces salmonicolor]